ncbi:MAG: dihydroorotase [Hyphomicrobiales bacterium]|nr:MAG: dihydroorotase [Hyphomicrobiales bacterium]
MFTNARIIDPSQNIDLAGELLVEKGKIAEIAEKIDTAKLRKTCKVTDCRGAILAPGLVDMRIFVGEPGAEHRETIASASAAAAAGGVTSILMMPDTNPVIDDVALVEFVRRTARETARVRVFPSAALTKGLAGEEMTEIGLLKNAGAVAFTDGRKSIASAQIQRRAMMYASDFEALIIANALDASLAGSGVMNSGANATRMGLRGIPHEAEIIPLERDMRLVAMTGSRYHVATLSAADSIDVIRSSKKSGLDVTAGVAIANLCLNDNDIGSYRTFFRLSPPLRSEDDRQALIEGVRDGAIDVICSNHDPQDVDTKRHPFAEAADGAVGLETLLAATMRLHHSDDVPLMRLLHCLSTGPARRLGLEAGTLADGAPADLVIFDPDYPWVLHEDDLRSRSKNTAFENARFQGRVLKTYVAGRKVFSHKA